MATDARRLCAASGVSVRLDTLPIAPAASAVAALAGADADAYALGGGEDFVLIAAVGRRAFNHLARRFRAAFGRDLLRVGEFTEGSGVSLANGAPIALSGWDHLGG
jgi:thiamine-monophosphate kinase